MTGAVPPVDAGSRRRDGVRDRVGDWGPPVLLLIGFLVTWEAAVRVLQIKQFILPAPIAIAIAWRTYLPELLDAASYTFLEIVLGLIIGATAGILVGAITARYRSMQDSLMPFAVAASSVPILAFAPLFNNWFGLDQQLSKAMIAAALCFFPVMINTVRGLTLVDPAAVELLRSVSASDAQVFWKLRVPNALPFIFIALRLAATLATIGAVVGEYFAAPRASLGQYIATYSAFLNFERSWAAIVFACAIGIGLYLAGRDRRVAGDAVGSLEERARLSPIHHAVASRGPGLAATRRSLDCEAGGGGPAPGCGPYEEVFHAKFQRGRGVRPVFLAACSSGEQQLARRQHSPQADPAPAPVVPTGPVRRLFRSFGQGLLQGTGLRCHDPARAVQVAPATVVAGGQAEFGISWVPRMLAPRESGAEWRSSSARSSNDRRRSRCPSRTRTSPSPRT